MASYEGQFIKARETFENRLDEIRAAILRKLEDDFVGDREDEVDITDVEQELSEFDDLQGDVSSTLDKLQDEIGRLES